MRRPWPNRGRYATGRRIIIRRRVVNIFNIFLTNAKNDIFDDTYIIDIPFIT
jgi:hypothetical protein